MKTDTLVERVVNIEHPDWPGQQTPVTVFISTEDTDLRIVRIITPTGDGPPEHFSGYVLDGVVAALKKQVLEPDEDPRMKVIEGITLPEGRINTDDTQLLSNIRSAIRRGHPQIAPHHPRKEVVALVCGGPSIESTLGELRDCIAEGAKVVTVNGSYQWCIDRNIIPSMQIVMDARPTNVRFLNPPLPRCHYALASQCHPDLWDAVEGRPNVWIYHVGVNEEGSAAQALLNSYYLKNWHGIGGGVTVGTRAIAMLCVIGYVQFHVFGMDCCWLNGVHHAYPQEENVNDQRLVFKLSPADGSPEDERIFECAPWHVKQFEGLMQMIRFVGNSFSLNLHGEGMAAYALRSSAGVVIRQIAAGAA